MDSESLITAFFKKGNVFAVVGVSRNPRKYGYKVYKDLKSSGYKVYPVNPNANKIDGQKCYPSLTHLPEKPDVVVTVVPPEVTEKIVKECKELKINKVWMQPGSGSKKAINFCKKNKINVINDICVIRMR